ncbi:hypothetical protein AArcSl_2183 [Halalkaliarchaeum desulfuricum]|uniref:Protein-glutamine gamma-glutamyltransferase-like C-terminal domain-containing protein n=1 Tax=Halalkaliarchaeum desulfuricum TaxID=2055893 RepID=A0A343TL36_9EURY|nr:hypothetical protein AArcSl_2183 [Halalkaliarchaeum desulfuricum]
MLAGALLATTVAFLTGTTDQNESNAQQENEADEEIDRAAVGRAAGRAAERLTREGNVDNEVYRAWREMTELLEVSDPETSTPEEFASAAIEAGFGKRDVYLLTRLFEDVRYGKREPSPERERRAIRTFRRIETRYTEEES